jgi:hypothetical protein
VLLANNIHKILLLIVLLTFKRSLNSDQKALIKTYAEMDKDVKNGTIDGITNIVSGREYFSFKGYQSRESFFSI